MVKSVSRWSQGLILEAFRGKSRVERGHFYFSHFLITGAPGKLAFKKKLIKWWILLAHSRAFSSFAVWFSACWLKWSEEQFLFTCHGQYGNMTAFVADENIMASVPCNQFTALWTQSPPENLINSHNVSKCCIVHLEHWFSWQMWKIRVARQLPSD